MRLCVACVTASHGTLAIPKIQRFQRERVQRSSFSSSQAVSSVVVRYCFVTDRILVIDSSAVTGVTFVRVSTGVLLYYTCIRVCLVT